MHQLHVVQMYVQECIQALVAMTTRKSMAPEAASGGTHEVCGSCWSAVAALVSPANVKWGSDAASMAAAAANKNCRTNLGAYTALNPVCTQYAPGSLLHITVGCSCACTMVGCCIPSSSDASLLELKPSSRFGAQSCSAFVEGDNQISSCCWCQRTMQLWTCSSITCERSQLQVGFRRDYKSVATGGCRKIG